MPLQCRKVDTWLEVRRSLLPGLSHIKVPPARSSSLPAGAGADRALCTRRGKIDPPHDTLPLSKVINVLLQSSHLTGSVAA